uniref:Uncharacterized protein n=1 Tax=Glossina brevipalpis TaxID=37001 RepID=A0A1A9WR68_9MUSC
MGSVISSCKYASSEDRSTFTKTSGVKFINHFLIGKKGMFSAECFSKHLTERTNDRLGFSKTMVTCFSISLVGINSLFGYFTFYNDFDDPKIAELTEQGFKAFEL